jgi:hypothetical protein
MFYSHNLSRYSYSETYKNKNHGRIDLPRAVFYVGYEFGKGWRVASEIEFEHGGSGAAVEPESTEAGEYETETEK